MDVSMEQKQAGGAPFYVAARGPGHTAPDLPTWASSEVGVIKFAPAQTVAQAVEYVPVPGVPGAFQLLNVLSTGECDQFLEIAEVLGFHGDAPVSLPRSVRHNDNFNWIVDASVDGPIWDRAKTFFEPSTFDGTQALGLNGRFRFYRYSEGDYFKPHTDGAWPDSRVLDGHLQMDTRDGCFSQMTFLIFLSGDYEGGRTLFQTGPDTMSAVSTPKGAVLVFPHGMHPDHCVHAGELIQSGQKYIIRTDVIYG
jgi:hypothetical protein